MATFDAVCADKKRGNYRLESIEAYSEGEVPALLDRRGYLLIYCHKRGADSLEKEKAMILGFLNADLKKVNTASLESMCIPLLNAATVRRCRSGLSLEEFWIRMDANDQSPWIKSYRYAYRAYARLMAEIILRKDIPVGTVYRVYDEHFERVFRHEPEILARSHIAIERARAAHKEVA